jgi:hypothetical protein
VTDQINTIAAALAKAQAKMGKAIKDSNNPAFRSKYADLGSVMDACLPALNECGISVVQPFAMIGDKYAVETILLHESGERLSCAIPLLVNKNDMQGLGSAMTYARRYGLMCMAGIAPEDDDGNAAAKAPPPKEEPAPRRSGPTDDQIAHDRAVIDAHAMIESAESLADLQTVWKGLSKPVQADPRVIEAKDKTKAALTPKPAADLGDDIPEHLK